MSLPTYIGACCREWILALGHKPGRCGLCGERPEYLRPDADNPDWPVMTTYDNGTPETPELRLPRILDDGCHGCGYSKVYCDCYQDLSGERCCRDCKHREVS